ncbi:MAG TPA: hypothetical protein VFB55_11130 [Verrucomicrobiae bacterium]|nr:hypothetical protein [Verrucomicrobiae bacterium]
MKLSQLPVAAVVALPFVISAPAQGETNSSEAAEMEALKNEIRVLEQKIEALEQQQATEQQSNQIQKLDQRAGDLERQRDVDRTNAAFPVYANPNTSAAAARAWAIGLNWWLNKNVRVMTSFSRTTFTGGNGAGATVTRQPEEVFFTRLQLSF